MESGSDLILKSIDKFIAGLKGARLIDKEALEELTVHLQDRVEDLLSLGMSADEACTKALAELGDMNSILSEFHKNRSRTYRLLQPLGRAVISKRVAAFSLLFIALTFGSIFAERVKYKSSRGSVKPPAEVQYHPDTLKTRRW